jgi:hypothetical protein
VAALCCVLSYGPIGATVNSRVRWVLGRLGMIVRVSLRLLYLIFLQLVNLLLLLGRALMHRRITAIGKLG